VRIYLTDAQLNEVEQIIEDTPIQTQQDYNGRSVNVEGTLHEAAQRIREYLSVALEVADAH
jgi:hypothetical protein